MALLLDAGASVMLAAGAVSLAAGIALIVMLAEGSAVPVPGELAVGIWAGGVGGKLVPGAIVVVAVGGSVVGIGPIWGKVVPVAVPVAIVSVAVTEGWAVTVAGPVVAPGSPSPCGAQPKVAESSANEGRTEEKKNV